MGSNVYYFDYYEDDQHDSVENGYKSNKNTKSFQRQSSPSGPTSYIKPRRPPPPVPRQLPRPKPTQKQRQTNYTERKSTPSLPRKPPPLNYRLYSIPEKEEEIHGEQSKRRKIMSEQKPQYKSTDSLLSKTSAAGLSTVKTDHHASMPEMSASGNVKIVEDLSKDGSLDSDGDNGHEDEDVAEDFSFIGTEPQYASTPLPQENQLFDFDSPVHGIQVENKKSKLGTSEAAEIENRKSGLESFETAQVEDKNSKTAKISRSKEIVKQLEMKESPHRERKYGVSSQAEQFESTESKISRGEEELVPTSELTKSQQSSTGMMSIHSLLDQGAESTLYQTAISGTTATEEINVDENVTMTTAQQSQDQRMSIHSLFRTESDVGHGTFSGPVVDEENIHKIDKDDADSMSHVSQRCSVSSVEAISEKQDNETSEDDVQSSHENLKSPSAKLVETTWNPLKTVDSVGQYFAKPSDLLKRKLKSQPFPSQDNNRSENVDTAGTTTKGTDDKTQSLEDTSTKVVKYDEKIFKDVVNSKLKKQDPFDQDSPIDITDQSHTKIEKPSPSQTLNDYEIYDEDEEIIKDIIFKKRHSEPHTREADEIKLRMVKSADSAVGYEDHHDFTSVVDFLEVLKIKEEQSVKKKTASGRFLEQEGKVIHDSEHIATAKDDTKTPIEEEFPDKYLTPPIAVDIEAKLSSYVVESRKRKYMPSVPSPLTLTDSFKIQGKQHKTISSNQDNDIKQEESELTDSVLNYTTPSKLLAKAKTREAEERAERSPGYGEMDYTAPSQLGMRQDEAPKMTDYFLSYTTPSKLLAKVQTRESQEKGERSPGYGEIDYTTPSQLGMRQDEALMADFYTSPSKLLARVNSTEAQSPERPNTHVVQPSATHSSNRRVGSMEEDSSGASGSLLGVKSSGQGDSFTNLHARTAETSQKKTNRKLAERPKKPGQMRNKEEYDKMTSESSQDGSEKIINLQRIPSVPSKVGNSSDMLQRDEEKGRPLYTTPSKLLGKVEKRVARENREKFPGYGVLDYRPPSKLGVDGKPKTKTLDNSFTLYTTPSQLLENIEKREARVHADKPPAYGEVDYTPPSQMSEGQVSHELKETRQKHHQLPGSSRDTDIGGASLRMDDERHLNGNRFLQKVKGSNVTRSPTISENIDNLRQGALGKTVDSGGECRSPTISEVFENVRTGTFGGQVRPSSQYGSFASTTPSMFLKRFAKGDSKTSITEEQCSEASKPNNKKLLERPKKSGQILNASKDHNRPSNTSEDDAEQFIKLQSISSAPNRVANSQNETEANTSYYAQSNTVKDSSDEQIEDGEKSQYKKEKRDPNVSHMHSDITAYFRYPSNENLVGRPCKRHRSEPEFFGMLYDSSNASWTEETAGTYDVKSTEDLKTSFTSSKSSDKNISPQTSSTDEPKPPSCSNISEGRRLPSDQSSSWMEFYYNSRERYSDQGQKSIHDLEDVTTRELDRAWSWNFQPAIEKDRVRQLENENNAAMKNRPSPMSSGYPSSQGTYKYGGMSLTTNPSFQALSPEGSTNSSQESMLSTESVHAENVTDQTASINQLFWSLYSSHPNLMQKYLNTDNHTPSQYALDSLSELYCDAIHTLASGKQDTKERFTSPQKKRALPHSPTSTGSDNRSFFMEKEVMESQNRKLQMEISTLTTENKLLKEKYNRATAKISDLEEELQETKVEFESLQLSVNQEVSNVQRKSKSEAAEDIDQLNNRITSLVHENEALKSEVLHLETQMQAASSVVDMARQTDKTKTLEAYKMEVTSLKDEVTKLKCLLEQSERHLHEEENRYKESSQQVINLTEMKTLLQQQVELGGGGNTVVDKQIKSLEKRLRVTEERLHQERSDRANNLSVVEDKLLTENARLQAAEKELGRQLQREKDKNCNLEQKIKDVRNENERLRLLVPFDEASLSSEKYDIPYSTHSSQRHETAKNHDFKHIATQLEQQAGIRSEKDMVCHLWSTREQAFNQLRQWEIMLQDLNLRDNDATEGLKNLRDLKCQYDIKLKQAEEKVEDSKSEKLTFESTYKEQLATLVKERHEAFAKLKTAEDLLEATKSENEILRKNLPALSAGAIHSLQGKDSGKESLQIQIQNLESKVQLLMRSNQVMEGELNTLKVQLDSREKALKDVESELELANSKLDLDKSDDRKQQKIDKLTVQVNSLQAEMGLLNDKYNRLLTDNRSLEKDVETARSDLMSYKSKQKDSMTDNKMTFSVKEKLEDKTRQVNSLTEEVNKLDTELQQTRQDLYQEQIQCNDYESQMESLQQQFEERGRIIDTISETEKGQLDQYRVLKVTLDSVNSELKEKESKVKILEVELSQQRDKLQQSYSGETTGTEFQIERDQLKSELSEAYTNIKTTEEEMHEMATEIQQLQQELTNQKTEVMQLSSEKGELEQHLEEIAEEHDALIQEKAQSEEDIVKLENKLQELVETLETEARKQHDNFQSQFEDIPPEYRQLAEELDTLRSLLEAKDKELDMFQVKTSRQQLDIEFLQRRIELLHNDNQSNREDIARMTNQLIFKMKEGLESRQLCDYLSGERVKIQRDVVQIESRLEKERSLQTVKQTEMEKSEFSKRDSVISSLETSLQQARKSLQDAEYDNLQLRYKIDTLSEDQRKLTTINSSLETKMEAERKMYEEKHQEAISSNHKLDLLQREHDHVLNNLNTEKQVKEKLNNDYQIYSSENHNLRQELRDIQIELENCQRQLKMSEDTLKTAKQDKGVMYHEYENMVKRLGEKDQKIIELQKKLDITVADMEKELRIQKRTREMEKTSAERELDIQKEQVTCLSAEMKTKDTELSSFGKALHELEQVTREKDHLERELQMTQGSVHDLKILLESHKKEILSLQDSLSKQQESVSKTQLEKAGVEDELHRLKESTTTQIQDLNKTIADLKSVNDGEKYYLKDNLSQTQTKLQSLESSLSSAIQSRDKLQVEYRMSQKALEDTKEQLQEETTSRKIAEQRADTLDSQLHESRKERFLTEEKKNKSEITISKLERELKSEKEKLKTALETNEDLEATAYSHETTAKSKQEQVDVLQNEVSKLKQILESQKVQLNSKLKKSAQDMTQQMELIELDRNKLSHQNSQLFADLEKSRETVQAKNKENLKLQEEILQLQDELKEFSFKVKHAEESKKTEEELQSKLQTKLQDQEEELKKVRNFLTKKAEESGEAEKSVWHDMNKMIQDMSKQMTMHLESQKSTDSKDRDTKVIQRYKKQIHDLNTELQTERALHKITAASLQSLEEDCVRLRQQCQAMRRRNNSASDKKYKSRMEAINEIIARSQSQAQAMLSTGNYLDDSLKTLPSPRVTFDTSPDNSISSDMSFNSTIAVHNNESSPSKPMKSTPR